MTRFAFASLFLLFAAAPLFAEVAPEAERAAAKQSLVAARGRYESVPVGLKWESLVVDGKAYRRARVHAADTWDATLFYDNGIRTVAIAKLPPGAQRLLGYDPTNPPAPRPAPPTPAPAPVATYTPKVKAKSPQVVWSGDPVARVLSSYGERPELRAEVNLRAEYDRLGLNTKDQGMSPSCSVFAVTSALEYHLAQTGRLKGRLAEEFLLWGTLRSLGKTKDRLEIFGGESRLSDGLALIEVAQSLRSYGIATKSLMPGKFDAQRETPPEEAQRDAADRCSVGSVVLSGRSREEQLEQMILALNEGIPVVIGLRWPKQTAEFARTGDIPEGAQEFSFGHAVVVVGYTCPRGDLSKTVFRFRNSYGERWGDHGYGTVSYAYLLENFSNGMFLDLR